MSGYRLKSKKIKIRTKGKKSIWKNRYFWDFILIFVFVSLGFYFIFISKAFKIKEVKVKYGDPQLQAKIEKCIEGELGQPFLYFFKKDTYFLANKRKIRSDVLKKYPLIKSVRIEKLFPNSLSVEIEKRKPEGICCLSDNSCYLFSGDGVVFEPAKIQPNSEATTSLPLVFLNNSNGVKLGDKIFSPEQAKEFLSIKTELESEKISIKNFILKQENELTIKTNNGWEIYFDLNKDLSLSLAKLKLLLEKGLGDREKENLKYIDLRFSKVFYRTKD